MTRDNLIRMGGGRELPVYAGPEQKTRAIDEGRAKLQQAKGELLQDAAPMRLKYELYKNQIAASPLSKAEMKKYSQYRALRSGKRNELTLVQPNFQARWDLEERGQNLSESLRKSFEKWSTILAKLLDDPVFRLPETATMLQSIQKRLDAIQAAREATNHLRPLEESFEDLDRMFKILMPEK